MLYYDNEWKLSANKIYYTDLDLNKEMENYVGIEGLEWWKNLKFIKINKIEELKYSNEEIQRLNEIKDRPQSSNSEELECYIKNIDYNSIVQEREKKEKIVTDEKSLPIDMLKMIDELQYRVLSLEKGVK